MAASDPTTRREAARTAARARVAGMTADERRAMTEAARRALYEADGWAVDREARLLGQHPLAPEVREFRIRTLAAMRARKASDAATDARARRRALVSEILRETAMRR